MKRLRLLHEHVARHTGLWQVSGHSQITDFDDVVRLDRDYIEGWTLALDVKILLKTVVVVLKRSGAE